MAYSLVIINLTDYRKNFLLQFSRIFHEFNLSNDEFDDLYDWLIQKALDNVLRLHFKSKVKEHYRHDVYRCVFDLYGHETQQYIDNQVKTHRLQFLQGEAVKVLVAGDTLIIARRGLGYA